MKLAIITDSTCDLQQDELAALNVQRVPLYVNFKGGMHKDWLEINPKDIVEGVAAGAGMPSTSQPSPEDFSKAYSEAVKKGAEEILCITISSDLSGTFQSANVAKESAEVPVRVFDTRAASLGVGSIVKKAAGLRDAGKSTAEIVSALETVRDRNMALFTVGTLDFLQKNGRIGGAQALLGGLLNIKPILTVKGTVGKIEPLGKARGHKKALKEMVDQVKAYQTKNPGNLVIHFLHIRDPQAAQTLKEALSAEGVNFDDQGVYEIGAVIASHVGPGTYGMYMYAE
jgi:DegV family protein with EDD domain